MNLAALLTAPAATPDLPALTWSGGTRSYGELADAAARLAGGLAADGVGPGDRVGIVCGNTPVFVTAYLGVLYAGAVAVPVNPAGTGEEIRRELKGTGAGLAIADDVGSGVLVTAAPSGTVVVEAGSPEWQALLAAAPVELVERADGDPAALVHTSGTSGAPRAAVLTHGNLAANIEQGRRHPTFRVERGDVSLAALPLFHVYGLNVVLGMGLAAGARLVLVERFDPVRTAELARTEGITLLAGVPPMFRAWLQAEVSPDAFSSVRLAVSGAAPLPVELQRRFKERFGIELHQGYGLTEASPVVSSTLGHERPREGSIGVPLPGVEVRLVDSDGDDVLTGDPGEIWVRGPNVFAGYLDDPEATGRVLTADGWLQTGDVAVADDEGWLSIVDRSKDLVIVSGFNVYPAEVEEVLLRHPAVEEAAVVGAPHEHTGETVKAFVVRSPGGQVDEDELVLFCAQHLARYKCPTAVQFVDELPHGLAGKVLRRSLEDGRPAG